MNESSDRAYLPALDHLRALAIAMVFVLHYRSFEGPWWLGDFGKFGWSGVDLFFVLSGYLIATPLLQRVKTGAPLRIRSFFIRRVLRIMPAFWVTLALYFSWPAFHEREALRPLWRYLTFTQNYGLDYRVEGTFSHAWSLCVEEQFYLVLPFMLLALRRRLRWAGWLLPALALCGLSTRWLVWRQVEALTHGAYVAWYRDLYYPTHQRLDGLIVGVSLAALMTFAPRARAFIAPRGNGLLLCGIVSITVAWWLCQEQVDELASLIGFPLIAASYGLFVASGLSGTSLLARVPATFTGVIAKLSYAVYLTHKGVIRLVHTAVADPGSTATFWLCVLCSLCVAGLIHILIERPALALAHAMTSTNTGVSTR